MRLPKAGRIGLGLDEKPRQKATCQNDRKVLDEAAKDFKNHHGRLCVRDRCIRS